MEEHRDGDAGDHPVREQRVLVREPRRLPRIRDGVRSPRLRRDPDGSAGRARAHRSRIPCVPGPQAARTTSSSFSSRRRTAASASRRAGASRTTSSNAATGSSFVARRPPMSARRCEKVCARRSPSKSSARSSAPRAAPVRCRASARSSSEKLRSSRKRTTTACFCPCAPMHRRGDQRPVALVGQQLSRALLEAVVAFERGRREDAPLLGGCAKRRDVSGEAGARALGAGPAGSSCEPESVSRSPRRLEHESRRAAERVARRLGERVESLAEGERRAEHLGDPVEAPLHLGLALALAEALGVVKREGREAGEGVEELEVASRRSGRPRGAQTPSTPRTSPSHVIGASMTSAKTW